MLQFERSGDLHRSNTLLTAKCLGWDHSSADRVPRNPTVISPIPRVDPGRDELERANVAG